MLERIKIGEYKGYRYVVTKIALNKPYCCGYIVIDKDLMKKLNIDYGSNEFSGVDTEVTYVYDSSGEKEWNLRFEIPLNENENVFGFDRGHLYSDEFDQGNIDTTENLCEWWIDWIIENSDNKE